MIRRPPRSTRTDTLFPYTTLFRSRTSCRTWGRRWSRKSLPRPATSPVTAPPPPPCWPRRSEEHTSELQSLMRISYAVFCLKNKKHTAFLSTIQTNHINNLVHVCQYDMIISINYIHTQLTNNI